MIQSIKYQSFLRVLESWEAAKQRYSCAEEVGMAILIELFRADASVKGFFGFSQWSLAEIERSPFLRMGLLVHGCNLVLIIDGLLGLIGPDLDILEEILQQHATTLFVVGVKPKHFGSVLVAMRQALTRTMGAAYSADLDVAWSEIVREASKTIIRAMA
jgi:Globin